MVYIIMGVSGSGKTTIGKMLAQKLSMQFYDADDNHTECNIIKMNSGVPLDDDDRRTWLTELAMNVTRWNKGAGAVLACSALKEKYRRIISRDRKEKVIFIHLQGDKNTIFERIKRREKHFFPVVLVESQFDALEAPQDAITVQIDKSPEEICAEIIYNLNRNGRTSQATR